MIRTASVAATSSARPDLRALQGAIVVLVAIVFAFAVMRLLVDVPSLLDDTLPEEEYDRRLPSRSGT